jgi:hypothetical protein
MDDPRNVELPEAVAPLEFLLGTWTGEGAGAVPGGGAADFPYVEELTFSCDGSPWITYTTAARNPETGSLLHAEAGWWRPQPADADGQVEVEAVLTMPTGVVEVLIGGLVRDNADVHVELASDVVARTPSGLPVTADKRLYALRGDRLLYAVDLAVGDLPLAPHLAAALDRVH